MNIKPSDSSIYLGEPAERNFWMAFLLSLFMPGLGHLYMGKPLRAINVQGFWLLALVIACCCLMLAHVFLLRVVGALVSLWLVLQIWIFLDLYQLTSRGGRTYILKPYNSPLVYGGLFIGLAVAPLWGTTEYLGTMLYGIHRVSAEENFPSLQEGDFILYAKNATGTHPIKRGEVVMVKLRDGSLSPLRVMGGPKDKIRVKSNGRVELNELSLPRQPLGRVQWKRNEAQDRKPPNLIGYLEVHGRYSYEVFMSPDVRLYGESGEELSDDAYFLLADNRTTDRALDSRHLGPFHKESIEGKALYVLYSVEMETGEFLWRRSGLLVD